MGKNRLEAFSDEVLAIIITIMVLELRVPHDASIAALQPLWDVLRHASKTYPHARLYRNDDRRGQPG